MTEQQYPIGTPGQPWGEKEKQEWLGAQVKRRSYREDVLGALEQLGARFTIHQYGALDYAEQGGEVYPLYSVRSRRWDEQKPTVLVTGGVHGYETSGVHGALHFLDTQAERYEQHFNILVVPCVSPWGYETINRWNVFAVDPNRSFISAAPADEAGLLQAYLKSESIEPVMHIDLHETTDTDNSEFRPALAAREGTVNTNWNIPDGFYLVADSERSQADFQQAIIEQVAKVTHIADADEHNQLIGADLTQHGVIEYPAKKLGLCMGLTDATYVTTTEVYPDSASATPAECVQAQVAVITAGLDYLLKQA